MADKRLIIGISGASGAIYGIRLLEALKGTGIETHLVISRAGQMTIASETPYSIEAVKALADHCHSNSNVGASIASGSFRSLGMIIAPCSIRSMSEIATGVTTSLLTRAADVMLKERRPLILAVRETPLHGGHLETMLKLSRIGAVIAPPLPAFYTSPATIEDIVSHSAGRLLDLLGIDNPLVRRWEGLRPEAE